MNFIGLDIHKKTISYCVKDAAGEVLAEGTISSNPAELGCLDAKAVRTVDGCHGGDHVYRLAR
jgi:predicted NBD/HSP70 family sugar kinase